MSLRFANPTSFSFPKDVLLRCLECLNEISIRKLKDIFLYMILFPINQGVFEAMLR